MAIDDPAASDWCNLSWTQWQPLQADMVRAFAPVSTGVYRIRRAGVAKRLTYIGHPMSALPQKADMDQRGGDVCFVPKADSCSAAKRIAIRAPRRRGPAVRTEQ
jgi:hypothetical protein